MTNFVFCIFIFRIWAHFCEKHCAHFSLKTLNVVQKMAHNLPTKWLYFLFVYWTCVITKQTIFSTKNLGNSSVNFTNFAIFLQFF
jgi:hypothetical protein